MSTVNKVPALGNVVQPELQREMNDHANRLNELVGLEGLDGLTGVVHVVAGVPSVSTVVTGEIANDAVTFAKMQNLSANVVIGAASAGDPVELSCTAAGRALIDDADAAAQRATLGVSYGKQTFVIPANGWELGSAARGVYIDAGTNHVWPTLDFDQTVAEIVYASLPMPKGWDLGVVQFHVYWTAASGTGTVAWTISMGSVQDNEALGDGYSTGSQVVDTLQTANALHISPEAGGLLPSSGGESVATHDMIKLILTRDTATDTLNADARLLAVKFTYNTVLHTDD